MRKILYSPGFGAGWTSWQSNIDLQKFMLTYQPFIDFLDSGGEFEDPDFVKSYSRGAKVDELQPIVKEFCNQCLNLFERVPYLGGLTQLKVAEVHGLVRINEYDGSESIEEQFDYENWI